MKTFLEFKLQLDEAVGKIIDAKDHPLYQERTAEDVKLHSPEEVKNALNSDATSVRIMDKGIKHPMGTLVGARLNLNVLKNSKIPVLTMHKATNKSGYKKGQGFYKGEAEAYHHVAHLKNAHFNVHQQGREDILSGKAAKHPMASVDGEFQNTTKPNFNGVEARFNPRENHLFVDGNGRAIKSAEDVTLHGHRAYLRGKIEYHTAETAPTRKSDSPSKSQLSESFDEYSIYFDDLNEETASLKHVADVKTNMPDAHFWIVRKGTADKVGSVTNTYSPEHIGVKITHPEVHPKFMDYKMQHQHMQGYWKDKAHGTLNLKNIRAEDVKNMPL